MSQAFTLRVYRRVKTRCTVEYSINGLNGTGIVHDVSLTGYRVVGDQYVARGDRLSLRIYLPLPSIPVEIESAQVQWVKGREFGLRPITHSHSAQATVTSFIFETAESECSIQQKEGLDAARKDESRGFAEGRVRRRTRVPPKR